MLCSNRIFALLCSLLLAGSVCSCTSPQGPASPEPVLDGGASSPVPPFPDAPPAVDAVPPPADGGAAAPSCVGLGPPAERDYTLTLQHGGLTRTALVHVPPGYDGSKAAPLVFNNHGSMCPAEMQATMSHLDEWADKVGVITVTPHGTGGAFVGWNVGTSPMGYIYDKVDDVGFFDTMINELAKTLCIDPKRIFCAGFSLGGSMCYRLSCDLSHRIAAIASVSGPDGTDSCSPKRPVPLLHIHGTADSFATYQPSTSNGPNKGAEYYVANHAKRSGCTPQTQVTLTKGKVTCKSYSCPEGVETTLCTVEDGGHTWPGGDPWLLGGTVNKDINASQMILEFFNRHPLP